MVCTQRTIEHFAARGYLCVGNRKGYVDHLLQYIKSHATYYEWWKEMERLKRKQKRLSCYAFGLSGTKKHLYLYRRKCSNLIKRIEIA